MQHHKGAVANHRIHLAVRLSQLDPQRGIDLIAHTGVAIFHVITLLAVVVPHPLQITRQAARGGDDHAVLRQMLVQHPQHPALG
ncbi:hypothetical protein D3C71_1361660 [compost metagenome]